MGTLLNEGCQTQVLQGQGKKFEQGADVDTFCPLGQVTFRN